MAALPELIPMNPYEAPQTPEDNLCPSCALDRWIGLVLLVVSIAGVFTFGILLGALIGNWH
jgi:hypothetical protein